MNDQTGSSLAFDGKWVVVTGASSGLGKACALELSRHGARLILVGRDAQTLAVAESTLHGAEHRSLCMDLADLDKITFNIATVSKDVGKLYGLCHAAGVVTTAPLSATTPEVVERMMTVSLVAGLELARAVCHRDVMETSGGSLLFFSSIYGRVGVPGQVAYCASKGAIASATRALAVELARRRIRVNSISPGLVRTPMTNQALGALTKEQIGAIEAKHPLGTGDPSDVAQAAVFLLAPATRWITGADLAVDGGYSAQ